nr:hypothetical protein [Dactylosporangium aurantiacum]
MPSRDDGLADLPAVGDALQLGPLARVLLADRRGALPLTARDVVPRRPDDTFVVDAVVRVERVVLGGDDGVLHVHGDLVERDDRAVLVADAPHGGDAVGVVDRGRLLHGQVLRQGDLVEVVRAADHADAGEHDERRDRGDDDVAATPALGLGAAAALALAGA